MIEGARRLSRNADLLVCPPATLVMAFAAQAHGSRVAIGAQDCHAEAAGAFTGDISAEMLADAGATAVIVGHSERRSLSRRNRRAGARQGAGRLARRADWRSSASAKPRTSASAGRTLDVVGAQLDGSVPDGATAENLVVAYEPVWAIGTGLTPTPADVAEVHGFIRERLAERFGAAARGIRILYGGSVKPSNAKELMAVADVDGALVGGASLKADDFLGIARAPTR